MEPTPVCPSCHIQVQPSFYFCPNCGRKLKTKPIDVSILKQIWIYAVSFFLPPLGLKWISYVGNPNLKTKIVGWIAIALTLISIIISIMLFQSIMQSIQTSLQGQMDNYQIEGL